MADTIKSGDIVKLKSDRSVHALLLTVGDIEGISAKCFFINPTTKIIDDKSIPIYALEKVS